MTTKPKAAPRQLPVQSGPGKKMRSGKLPRGYGSMRDVPLSIDPRIDLTKPIYEQVLALQKADKEAEEQSPAG